jgi:hypothetical protein
LEAARTLPQEQWCKAVLPYTTVDPAVVERYRQLSDLEALEAACLYEIADKEDWAKSACGEVCHRVLRHLQSDHRERDEAIHRLFYAITERLIRYWVGHWRRTWKEEVLQDAVQEVYTEFYKTARRHTLTFLHTVETMQGQSLQLPCYTALLAFLKRITIRVVFAEWRQKRRAEVQAFLRFMHREAPRLPLAQKRHFQTWVWTHVVGDEVERAMFEGVLAGTKPQQLLAHPLLQQAFLPVHGAVNKQLANRRDALLRRVWKAMAQSPPAALPEFLHLVWRLITETTEVPAEQNEG